MDKCKRILCLVMTAVIMVGLLVPGSSVLAANETVEYDFIEARTQYGSEIKNIFGSGFDGWTEEKYNDEVLDWYIGNSTNSRSDASKLSSSYGIFHPCNMGDWITVVFRAPGSGTYTLKLDHSLYSSGAELALAYVMPIGDGVNESKIRSTVETTGAVGSVSFQGSTSYMTETTTLGTYSFTAGEEYAFVLYASEGSSATSATASLMFHKLTAVKGTVADSSEPKAEAMNLGAMVTEFGMRTQVAVAQVGGYDYYFLPIKGGTMQIYNLDYYCDGNDSTNAYQGSVSIGIGNAWGCSAGEDGKIYVTGDAKYVYRYDPVTGKGDKLTFATDYVKGYDVTADKNGNIYIGSAQANAGVAYYDNAAGTFKYYYGLDSQGIADSCTGVAYDDSYIYAFLNGTDSRGTRRIIVKVDKATGTVVKEMDVEDILDGSGNLTLNLLDGVLFGGSTTLKSMIAIDTQTWQHIDIGVDCGVRNNVSDVWNGNAYFVGSSGYIYQYNLEKRKATSLNFTTGQALNASLNSIVTLDTNGDGVDEHIIFTCRPAKDGYPILLDPVKKKAGAWADMLNTSQGEYMSVRDVYPSNDGSNNIYVGAYVCSNATAYNTKTGELTSYVTAGQTDSQIMYKGVLYAGNYATCTLAKINVQEGTYEELTSLSSYKQKRIHCLASGEDKIFFSSVPDTYDLNGYLAWYDLKTGETFASKLSDLNAALENQVVMSIAYTGGYLYCGTTVRGGSSSTPVRTTSHFFVVDVATKKVVAIQEIAFPYIASLDADSSGTVWGVISKTLFKVSYSGGNIQFTQVFSKESGTLLTDAQRTKEASSVAAWWCKTIYFGSDGYLYLVLGDTGLWKISKTGSATLLSSAVAGRLYALGEDGNIYYGSGTNLYILPLNVSSSDKSAAKSVNTKLDSLLRTAPGSTASAFAAALEAYEKLTGVQKTMVPVSKLQTAQRRLTVALISSLPATVTAANAATVRQARTYYSSLNDNQKALVSNYSTLVSAEAALQKLLPDTGETPQNKAEAVIAMINALPSNIVWANKTAVEAARAAYDALPADQKALVTNYSTLTAAETKIAAFQTQQDKNAAVKVVDLIEALPETVTANDRGVIEAARAAYDALTEAQKGYVTNYGDLVAAELNLKLSEGGTVDASDVEAVKLLIASLPDTITLENYQAVITARTAYDALPAEKQAEVTNYHRLIDAEAALARLEIPEENGETGPNQGADGTGTPEGGKPGSKGLPGWVMILIIAGGLLLAAGAGIWIAVTVRKKKASEEDIEK